MHSKQSTFQVSTANMVFVQISNKREFLKQFAVRTSHCIVPSLSINLLTHHALPIMLIQIPVDIGVPVLWPTVSDKSW